MAAAGLSQRFWVQRGVCGSIPASVQSKGKRGVVLSSFGLPGLPLRGRPSGEPSSREGYQGSGRLHGGQGACWERRCRNDSNFVNREFVKDAVKANAETLLYAADGCRNDRGFVKDTMKANAEALLYAAGSF